VFCPYCGVNNDRGEGNCFICEKPLPSLAPTAPSAPGSPERPRRKTVVQAEVFGGAGDRMLALFFDRVVILCIAMIGSVLAVDRWGALSWRSGTVLYGGGAALFLLMFIYHLLFEGSAGTTIGKAIMGLQVRTIGGRGKFGAVALRNLLRLVDGLGFYVVGFLFTLFTARRQRVGDLVGGTVVMDASLGRGARAAMLVLWIAIVATALWVSNALCPTCRPDVPFTIEKVASTR
jgi:uncharacterized RDD family membrane protein YckC